jgi:protein-tyrosine phosphatase
MDLATDVHTHLAPGVDDGSRGPVETIAMARGLRDLGVRRVHVTPHQFRYGCDFTLADLEGHTSRVRTLLREAGVDLEVFPGAEYCYGERFVLAIERGEDLATFAHGGARCLLVELPMDTPVTGVHRLGEALLRQGVRPVLAHPERYPSVSPERLAAWRRQGWLFQLDLPSLAGMHGGRAQACAGRLVAEAAYDLVGSDLHRPGQLDAVRRGGEELARMLAEARS